MSWTVLTVEWTGQAIKDLRGLPAKDVRQIRDAVELFATTGRGDVIKLQGKPGHRMRVRDRRVFLLITWSASTLSVLEVRKRGDAY